MAVLTVQLNVPDDQVEAFKRDDLLIVPHESAERAVLLHALADLETACEATGNERTVAAFRVVGEMFARAKFTGKRKSDA